jgi:hypothetical protein
MFFYFILSINQEYFYKNNQGLGHQAYVQNDKLKPAV